MPTFAGRVVEMVGVETVAIVKDVVKRAVRKFD